MANLSCLSLLQVKPFLDEFGEGVRRGRTGEKMMQGALQGAGNWMCDAGSHGAQPRAIEPPEEGWFGCCQGNHVALGDEVGLDEAVVGVHFPADGIAVPGGFSVQVLFLSLSVDGHHSCHPVVVQEGANGPPDEVGGAHGQLHAGLALDGAFAALHGCGVVKQGLERNLVPLQSWASAPGGVQGAVRAGKRRRCSGHG